MPGRNGKRDILNFCWVLLESHVKKARMSLYVSLRTTEGNSRRMLKMASQQGRRELGD
jgi:hypothetical protein